MLRALIVPQSVRNDSRQVDRGTGVARGVRANAIVPMLRVGMPFWTLRVLSWLVFQWRSNLRSGTPSFMTGDLMTM